MGDNINQKERGNRPTKDLNEPLIDYNKTINGSVTSDTDITSNEEHEVKVD